MGGGRRCAKASKPAPPLCTRDPVSLLVAARGGGAGRLRWLTQRTPAWRRPSVGTTCLPQHSCEPSGQPELVCRASILVCMWLKKEYLQP
jgi:hypothetical protein